MTSPPPEHRRPTLIDINLAPVVVWRPPVSLFSVILLILALIGGLLLFPFALLAQWYAVPDIPNVYSLAAHQQEEVADLEADLLAKQAELAYLQSLVVQAGDLGALIDEVESLLAAMEQDYLVLSEGRVTWSTVLEEIDDAAPTGITITSISQGSDLTIEGTADSDLRISEYASALEDTGLFSQVRITETELATTTEPADIVVEDCEYEWNRGQLSVFTWADSKDYQVGLYSAKQSITTSFSTGTVAYQNVATDLRNSKYIVFWIKSSTDQPQGVFQLVFYSPALPALIPTLDPTIAYSPLSFFFSATEGGANPSPQTLSIWNSGGGALEWEVADDAAWLTLDPTSGTATTETDTVTLTVDISGMIASDESYTATITISDPDATNTPQTVTAYLKINPFVPPTPTPTPTAWPAIEYSPLSLCSSATEMGPNPSTQTLFIRNSGGGTLNWSVTSNAAWLTLGPPEGTSTGETDNVTVAVDMYYDPLHPDPDLPAGSYTATITIKDPSALNSPQKVTAYLTIRSPTPVERLDIPALTADTWTEVILPLSNTSDLCPDYSVALNATRDPGACIVWLDAIRATTGAAPGDYTFEIIVTLLEGGQ